MPETLDFEQIATHLCESLNDPWGHPIANDIIGLLHRATVEQLRQVWNARGAADIDALADGFHITAVHESRVIHALDR